MNRARRSFMALISYGVKNVDKADVAFIGVGLKIEPASSDKLSDFLYRYVELIMFHVDPEKASSAIYL
jgi:hypothetical protein